MTEKHENNYKAMYNPNRFNALDSAVAYILVLVAFLIIPEIISAFFKSAFKSLYEYDYYAYMLVNIFISQSIIFLVALVYSKARRVEPFDGGGYKAKWDGVQILFGMTLVVGVMMTFYYVHLQFMDDAESIIGSYYPSDINTSFFTPLYALIYILVVSLLPALIEEMMFRGIIMRGLEQFGVFTAVIVSSLAFSLMHGSFSQMILQFIGGIAIATAVILTKNWLLGSAMHFFNNLFSVVFAIVISDYAVESAPELKYVPFVTDAACIMIGIVCLIVGATYFCKLAFKKKINEIAGKIEENKQNGKRVNYAVKDGEIVTLVSCYVQAETLPKTAEDERRFLIGGKFRKLNFSANPKVATAFLSIGFLIAIVSLFI